MQGIQGQNLFDSFLNNPPTFKWSDLNGKELSIRTAKEGDFVVAMGYEKSSDKFYVLYSGTEE